MHFRYFQKDGAHGIAQSERGAESLLNKGYTEISEAEAFALWCASDLATLQQLIEAARGTWLSHTQPGARIDDTPALPALVCP